MISKLDKVIFAVILLVFASVIIFRKDFSKFFKGDRQASESSLVAGERDKQEKLSNETVHEASGRVVKVTQEWKMPDDLSEISAIAYLDGQRFVCLQDEEGALFFYNTGSGKIEKKIPFGASGDYEGISLAGNNAYAVNSSGAIFEIADYSGSKPVIKTYQTPLTNKNDVEGIGWDKEGNRLLVTVKEDGSKGRKGIYTFDLATKTMAPEPAMVLDFDDAVFKGVDKKNKGISPSSIEMHPTSGQIYILEGTNPKLLVLSREGKPEHLYVLDKKSFPQPEGLTFDPKGNLYISNEGKKGSANIVKVSLQ